MTGLEELRGQFLDFLPQFGLLPVLSPDEVARFVAAGEAGRARSRAGDAAGAEEAFRAQIAIYPANHEPWLYLAMSEASRGAADEAREHLRQAVLRGFRDLRTVERAEAWRGMRRTPDHLDLIDALPVFEQMERDWPPWNTSVPVLPQSYEAVLRDDAALRSRLEAMAPALGPRNVGLWGRVGDRVMAANLEALALGRPDAPDYDRVLDHALRLYSGGVLDRWQRVPADTAARLKKVSDRALARSAEDPTRPSALLAGAIARFAERNDKDGLEPRTGQQIMSALEEITRRHPESPLVAPAVVGLVQTEIELRRPKAAAARYRSLLADNQARPAVVDRVRQDLGITALWLGGLPEFRASSVDGRTVESRSLEGSVVVLDFWATWCAPCLEEIPTLRRIEEQLGQEVTLLGVNLDAAEEITPELLREWIAREQIPGDQLHDGLSWDSALVRAFGVKEIPFSVVFGPGGDVLAVNEHGKSLEKAVRLAVREAAASAAEDPEELRN